MLEVLVIVFICAKIKKYDMKNLLKSWTIYPIIIMEVIYLFIQVQVFQGDYEVIQYLKVFKNIYLISYLFLVFKYDIYIKSIIASGFLILGGVLNDIAIAANHGYMPVFASLSYITGYINENSFKIAGDIHILGNAESNLKILTDFIDIGYSVLSIGDIFIRLYAFIILYGAVKKASSYGNEEVDKLC